MTRKSMLAATNLMLKRVKVVARRGRKVANWMRERAWRNNANNRLRKGDMIESFAFGAGANL